MAVLHRDEERDKCRVLGAERCKLVGTGACDVILLPIEGGVMGISGCHASRVAGGMTAPVPIHQGAFLIGLAAHFLAKHHAQARVTHALSTAVLISPENFPRLIELATIGAVTAVHKDASPSTEDVSRVTLA